MSSRNDRIPELAVYFIVALVATIGGGVGLYTREDPVEAARAAEAQTSIRRLRDQVQEMYGSDARAAALAANARTVDAMYASGSVEIRKVLDRLNPVIRADGQVTDEEMVRVRQALDRVDLPPPEVTPTAYAEITSLVRENPWLESRVQEAMAPEGQLDEWEYDALLAEYERERASTLKRELSGRSARAKEALQKALVNEAPSAAESKSDGDPVSAAGPGE